MQPIIQTIQEESGKREQFAVYPVGNLAGNIAGQGARYAEIGAARTTGIRLESFNGWDTIQNQQSAQLTPTIPPLGG